MPGLQYTPAPYQGGGGYSPGPYTPGGYAPQPYSPGGMGASVSPMMGTRDLSMDMPGARDLSGMARDIGMLGYEHPNFAASEGTGVMPWAMMGLNALAGGAFTPAFMVPNAIMGNVLGTGLNRGIQWGINQLPESYQPWAEGAVDAINVGRTLAGDGTGAQKAASTLPTVLSFFQRLFGGGQPQQSGQSGENGYTPGIPGPLSLDGHGAGNFGPSDPRYEAARYADLKRQADLYNDMMWASGDWERERDIMYNGAREWGAGYDPWGMAGSGNKLAGWGSEYSRPSGFFHF